MKIGYSLIDFSSYSQHQNGSYTLEFTVHELFHAAYTVGKDSWEKVTKFEYYSEQEMQFRISMVRAFLKCDTEWIERADTFDALDPSEKTSINYFFGMVFCNLIMQKKFNLQWLLHLDLFEGKIDNIDSESKRKPDFLSRKSNSGWSVIEAKGRLEKRTDTIKNAKDQLRNLKTIDGEYPEEKMVTLFYGKKENLHIEVIDPKERKELTVSTASVDYGRDYYAQIYNLLKTGAEGKIVNGKDFIVKRIPCHRTTVGMLKEVFNLLEKDTAFIISEKVEFVLKSNIEVEDRTDLHCIGKDGVYVSAEV